MNTFRSAHETIIKNFGQNVVAVSTDFRIFSDRVEASLATPKIEETSTHVPPAVPSIPSSKSTDIPTVIMNGAIYFTREPPRSPKREDFPNIYNWLSSSYKLKRKVGKKGEIVDTGENGRKPDPGSILSCYMVDEQGGVIPKSMKDAARTTARGFFQLLLEIKRAPPNWGVVAIDIKNELRYRLETEHEFLRYCHDHWKADMIATNSYSQWVKIQLEPATNMKTPAEVLDVDSDNNNEAQKQPRDEEKDISGSSKRPRVKEALPPLSARRRNKPPLVEKKPQAVCKFLYTGCRHH